VPNNFQNSVINKTIIEPLVIYSKSSNSITTGSKSFVVNNIGENNANIIPFSVGYGIVIMANNLNYMRGTITSYNQSTQTIVVNVTDIIGSGTFSNWQIQSTPHEHFCFDTEIYNSSIFGVIQVGGGINNKIYDSIVRSYGNALYSILTYSPTPPTLDVFNVGANKPIQTPQINKITTLTSV
jgi:hypothetical protein